MSQEVWQMKKDQNQILKTNFYMPKVSSDGENLIVGFEVSDKATYEKLYSIPTVPCPKTTSSGITIGIGYDCSTVTKSQLYIDWSDFLTGDQLDRLAEIMQLTGEDAYNKLNTVNDIVIQWDEALGEFSRELDKFYNICANAFPNFENSPQCVIDIIVSLVYNRGASVVGSSRSEMLNIKNDISSSNWNDIPTQIISMKRLWPNIQGLCDRRDAEAQFLINGLKLI